MRIENTKYYSKKIGTLPQGCKLCVQGKKLVLFVTGLCSRRCWFCPLAETKKFKDVVFANEWKIGKDNEIIKEAELCGSGGAGMTGGDPFIRLERTVKYIKMLKKRFGNEFHIHLYAPMPLITAEKLRKLCNAGLDEIRLHPDFYNRKDWNKIDLVRKFDWDIGVEIPVIPGLRKKTAEMIDFFADKIDFLNLNELEISETNVDAMRARGLRAKSSTNYGVKGSEELALQLLKYCIAKKYKFNVHYCTTKLKDAVQLANRLKRRAMRIARAFDIVDEEGMLTRGAIYLEKLKPGFGYRKMLESIEKKEKTSILKKLNKLKNRLQQKYGIKKELIAVDNVKLRILIDAFVLDKIKESIKKENLVPALVEEYPTWDEMEITVTFL